MIHSFRQGGRVLEKKSSLARFDQGQNIYRDGFPDNCAFRSGRVYLESGPGGRSICSFPLDS